MLRIKLISSRLLIIILFILSIPFISNGQEKSQVISVDDFLKLVIQYHPVAQQAELLSESAKSEIRMARGLFDPTLKSNYSKKEFDEKTYWKIWENYLTIPVLPGFDVKAGYEFTEGDYLNPERNTPEKGLSTLGISIPLGQGLFIDDRRKILGQAKLLTKMAEADKVKMINKLLLQAVKEYYDWAFFNQRLNYHKEFVALATTRYEAIKDRVRFGDLPAIDSLEALVELENRKILLAQSQLDYQRQQLIVSNYLWTDEQQPLQVTDSLIPIIDSNQIKKITVDELKVLLDTVRNRHPDLIKADIKIEQLSFDKRLAREKLKPKLNIDYNILSGNEGGVYNDYQKRTSNQQKYGLNFSIPLFLREERGKLLNTGLKINTAELDRIQTERELTNQVLANFKEVNILNDQLSLLGNQVSLSEKLLNGEIDRFKNSEGSLFLVNNRETALINSKIRLAETESKYFKSKAQLVWSAGIYIAK
jgi:outer membrane protein TolC